MLASRERAARKKSKSPSKKRVKMLDDVESPEGEDQ